MQPASLEPVESDPDVTASGHMRLGEWLLRAGRLDKRDLDKSLTAQDSVGGLLGAVLLQLGLVSEQDVAHALAQQFAIPLIGEDAFPDAPIDVPGLSRDYLLRHRLVPLRADGKTCRVAMDAPQDDFLIKAMILSTGLRIEPCIATETDLRNALQRLYLDAVLDPDPALDDTRFTEDTAGAEGEFVEHLKDLASEAPVITLVNRIVARVIDLRASDIHIESFEDGLHIRYRVDGALLAAEIEAASVAPAVISRIKLLAHLNIAERRLPQDGRVRTRVKGHELDLRVSTLPTLHGESVVIRVLDRASVRLDLNQMGFASDMLTGFRQLIARPHGIVLVTGPTGSGKTTTLYAALGELDAAASKILTVEDPVEYQLPGINQLQVQPQIGLSFAHALRAILRQDPDTILIGEMRDTETARIAVQSALTGHRVLSTLHTNTAATAITRLEDMGIERYLITSTVSGVLAQRLVRRLCPHCKRPTRLPPDTLAKIRPATQAGDDQSSANASVDPAPDLDPNLNAPPLQPSPFTAVGCPQCRHTGYHGRTAIHELLVLDTACRDAVLAGADAAQLQTIARNAGMRTLHEDGLRKVWAGETSLEEVMRVAQDEVDV